MLKVDKTLDIQGLVHPRSIIVIETTMTSLDPGQLLKIITDDMNARDSVSALCSYLGCTLIEVGREGRAISFTIQKVTGPRAPGNEDGHRA